MAESEIVNNSPKEEMDWLGWIKNRSPEEIATKLKELEFASEHDELTKVYNKRGWEKELERFDKLSERMDQPLSFLYADIDDFEKFNNEWGHEAGDQVLIFVSGVLTSLTRESDVVARLGGDEFGVLLPFTDEIGAKEVKDKIIAEIERSLNEMEDSDLLAAMGVKLSIGMSTKKVGESVNEAIASADKDMYKVKRLKKND
ncbi:GGDEF domain-containing protein [Candidatus Woesebacteria bacterium]|nr:GGDEF domain-containing protein [Candidatus Woesebacteria bacterium]